MENSRKLNAPSLLLSDLMKLSFDPKKCEYYEERVIDSLTKSKSAEGSTTNVSSESLANIEKLIKKMALVSDAIVHELTDKSNIENEIASLKQEVMKKEQTVEQLVNTMIRMYSYTWEIFRFAEKHSQDLSTLVVKILDKFEQELKKIGITVENPKGKKYDTSLHQIVSTQQVEGMEEETIIDVLSVGFIYNGKILRKAQVVTVLNNK